MSVLEAMDLNMEATLNNLKDRVYCSEYSQKDISEYVGCDSKTLKGWLNGTKELGLKDLVRLCQLLGIEVEDLLVKNYQVEYSTLSEQRKYVERELQDLLHMMNRTKKMDMDATLLLNELEVVRNPAYTINEMMMYFQLMDYECIHHLQERLINVGMLENDREYIRKTFKYVIDNMMIETDKKKDIDTTIDYCTHNPYILYSTDYSLKFKTDRLHEYWKYEDEHRQQLWKGVLVN